MDISPYEAMAKLSLPANEREVISARMDVLTESFNALETIETVNVEPLVTVLEVVNVLRGDVAARLISREELLSGAPEQYDGYFQVPRTLE